MSDRIASLVVSLTYPPTLSSCLALLALILLALKWRKAAAGTLVLALAWSALWSVPVASDGLRGLLENRYPRFVDAAGLPRADAIVVLGGGNYSWLRRQQLDSRQLRSSRVAAGARAWRAGRAPVIILSGGGNGQGSEAREMALAMRRLGIPSSALLLEENSTDTRGNAKFTARIARRHGIRRMLLVTSSLHMPRAVLLFRDAGIDVVPVPVEEVAAPCGWKDCWIPSRGALWRSGRAWKEIAGLLAAGMEMKMKRNPASFRVTKPALHFTPAKQGRL